MGLGPPVLALYCHLKRRGVFDGITDVIELGSQGVWCPDRRLLERLFAEFGRPLPPDHEIAPYINSTGTGHAASRHLHERLGFRYQCLDIDENFGALALDLNFDTVPAQFRNQYGLTTNHGTTEHILDQYNCFKVIHELTAPGGIMLHVLPFTVHLEHGFFNYQPNLFAAIARSNSYRTIGIWIGLDWRLKSLVPYEKRLVEFLAVNSSTTQYLLVVQQKMHDADFRVPRPGAYDLEPDIQAARWGRIVDGEYYSGQRLNHVVHVAKPVQGPTSLDDFPSDELALNLTRRIRRRLRRMIGPRL